MAATSARNQAAPPVFADIRTRLDETCSEIERVAYQRRLEAFLACREGASALAENSLRAGISVQSVIRTAADLAEYADEAITIVKDEYRPRLDCMEGCSYCCCKPGVLTSIPELLRIVRHVHSTFDAADTAALGERAREYAKQIDGCDFNQPTAQSVPCPLLVNGRCSVYAVRPLVCRGYNSTSVDACRRAHEDPNQLVPIFSVIKDATDGATIGAAQQLRAAGFNDALVDLGSALNIALAGGERFPESLVEGSPALASAENSTFLDDLWNCVRETALRVGTAI